MCVRAYAGTTFRIGHCVRKRIYLPCIKAKIASWTKCRKIRDTPHLANKKHSTSPWCKGSEEFMWCMWRNWELMKGFTMKTKDLTYLHAVEIYLIRATAIFRKTLWNGIRTFFQACPCMSVWNFRKIHFVTMKAGIRIAGDSKLWRTFNIFQLYTFKIWKKSEAHLKLKIDILYCWRLELLRLRYVMLTTVLHTVSYKKVPVHHQHLERIQYSKRKTLKKICPDSLNCFPVCCKDIYIYSF